jgi:dihydrofolate synthase / folylpolyglutamate synthase
MSTIQSLGIFPLTTRVYHQGENLLDFVVEQVKPHLVQEAMIVAVTSKIVSLAENRLVEKTSITKARLIDQEADYNLGEVGYGCFLTIKHGLFIPSAGIDESNSERDQYILYPKDPFLSARNLWDGLRRQWGLKKLGIVLTDSHTTPLRRGVTGISLAHWGFRGLKDLIGTPDLFGRRMQMTTVNVADGLAAAATLMMGEANECRPLAIIQCSDISFVEDVDALELKMPVKDDLYYPFFKQHL